MSGPMRSSNEDFAGWLDSERMGDSAIVPSGSVVICSRNRPHLLRDCVHSLIAGTAQPTEIIVVDQSQQSDSTLEFLAADHSQSCRVHYHWTPQRGLSRAMNLAVGLAHHNFLLFTHDDVIVDKGWYAAMIAALAEAVSPTIITGRVVASDEPIRGGFVPSLIVDRDSRHYRGRIDNDVLYPMNMAMHRTTFNLVGQFDERLGPGTPYPAAEDNDYGFRALEHGVTIQYLPDAEVQHRAWRTDINRLRWHYALGQGAFYAKHVQFRERHMLRRLGREASRYLGLTAYYATRLDRRAVGYAASAAGLAVGAVSWHMRYRLRRRAW